MGQKKEVRMRSWDKGILYDMDRQDTPIDSLTSAINCTMKENKIVPIKSNELLQSGLEGIIDYSIISRAYFAYSRYDPDGVLSSTEYLYISSNDGTDGSVQRLYRASGSSTWLEDTTFGSIALAPSSIDSVQMVSAGEYIAITGTGYDNDFLVYPYNVTRFKDSSNEQATKGWFYNPTDVTITYYPDTTSAKNDVVANTDHISIAFYTANYDYGEEYDIVKYYCSVVLKSGYESTLTYIATASNDPTTHLVQGKILIPYVNTGLSEDVQSIRFYKETNSNGKYFLGEIDTIDGVVDDYSGSGVYADYSGHTSIDTNWIYDTDHYTLEAGIIDTGVYNTPYEYISGRNGADRLPGSCVATFKGRLLYGGEDSQVNGVLWDAVYVTKSEGYGSVYKEDYVQITKAAGEKIIAVASFKDYILVFYERRTFILDGSHPNPAMWREIAQLYHGVATNKAVKETSSGIIFANSENCFMFNGTVNELINDANKEYWQEFSDDDMVISFDADEQIIYIANTNKTIMLNKRLALTEANIVLDNKCFVDNWWNGVQFIERSPALATETLYQLNSPNSYGLSLTIASGDIDFGSNDDKFVFKFKLRSSGSAVSAHIRLTNEDGMFYDKSVTLTNGNASIMLKQRFETLKYEVVAFTNEIEEVSILVGQRKYNRGD